MGKRAETGTSVHSLGNMILERHFYTRTGGSLFLSHSVAQADLEMMMMMMMLLTTTMMIIILIYIRRDYFVFLVCVELMVILLLQLPKWEAVHCIHFR